MTLPQLFSTAVEHHRAGRLAQAAATYRQCQLLDPLAHEVCFNLGNVLRDMSLPHEAVAAYRQCLSLRPNHAPALTNLGRVLRSLDQLDEAISLYRQAITLQPQLFEAHYNLANALLAQREVDQSILAAQKAIAIKPDHPLAHNALAQALQMRGELHNAIAHFDRALALNPNAPQIASNRLFALLFDSAQTPQTIRTELDAWDAHFAQPLRPTAPTIIDRSPDRKLRIGYVSADFCQHVIAWNLLPLLSNHDHQSFEIVCYSNVRKPDAMTLRLQACADLWRTIHGTSDPDAAAMIRADRIDILVDLSLHTAGNRLLIFAQKPAPVQATFAAYPGSTGMAAIDWRLTDPRLDPPGNPDAPYIEKSHRLPHSFWCYTPEADIFPDLTPPPALKNGYITLGCLNTFCKVNDGMLALFARVLHAIPQSRLILLAPPGHAPHRVRQTMANFGIDPDRLDFVPYQPRQRYLAEFNRIDLCLDTLPYNGHTTSLDSLWMGVPFVTRIGDRVVGRGGLSHLYNLSLTHLAADNDELYIKLAADLAHDLPRLTELRRTMRDRMKSSPLTNAKQFAAAVETAYRHMWKLGSV